MTAKPTCPCGVDIEGMRLARAEDHKACARLAARVRELEAEVRLLRSAMTFDQVAALGFGRRGANWTPPKSGERCFTAQEPDPIRGTTGDEWCASCSRHISAHFGGTEYRCDPRETLW
jgi:hypothetical protein